MNEIPRMVTFALVAIATTCGLVWTSEADVSKQTNWTVASGGNGHTYRVVAKSGLVSWNAASTEAQAAGGYLATITSAAENTFIFSLVNDPTYWTQTANGHGPWIGGYQQPGSIEPNGGWTWVTQTGAATAEAFSFTNWEAGEPNNLTTTVGGVTYNQDRVAFFHTATGRAATWSDEYNLTGANLNQWTISYVIEFNPVSPVITAPEFLADGSFQFTFTNIPGAFFSVLTATNAALPLTNWTAVGGVTEISSGQFRFKDSSVTNSSQRFYRIKLQ